MLAAVATALGLFLVFVFLIGWACCALGGIADDKEARRREKNNGPR